MKDNLKISNLNFSYKNNEILKDINLELNTGINVLLGENGAGKSTLMKILATILPYSSGNIELNQHNYKDISLIKSNIAYLPQTFNLYAQLKGIELLKFVAKVKLGSNKETINKEINRVIEVTDINDYVYKNIKSYSEGMRRRLGIAQSLIGDPKLLIVDEPTAGLDPQQRINFNKILSSISQDRIILLSTHIIEDIESFYKRVIILNKKQIRFSGTYEEFLKNPSESFFIGKIKGDKLKDLQSKYLIISQDLEEDAIKCKFFGEVDRSDFIEVTEATPTLQDIWTYYQLI
ncbi:ATP-binding cassette domain-containing protein [Clostridium sp. MSJ-4]|uniref:ATP-binding cassette domain-containing protein n=1 Tax=Clostridium simiarum TaxID=2841506 RepID=A0ABS6F3X6_9CLOT|nr:ATP-binding cassette domain-containing protein [Clostridium simiarum]